MDASASKELAYSMLNATGSMHILSTELDRLSLHSVPGIVDDPEPSPPDLTKVSYKDHNPHWLADWSTEDSALSADSTESPQVPRHSRMRRISRSSSNFDSAIGSLQLRTDEEMSSLHSPSIPHHRSKKTTPRKSKRKVYTLSDNEWLYHTQQIGTPALDRAHLSHSKHGTGKEKESRSRKHHTDSSPSSSIHSTPTRKHHRRHRHDSQVSTTDTIYPLASSVLWKERSTHSRSSTGSFSSDSSKRSSQALSLGLSEEDIFKMTQINTNPKYNSFKASSTAVIPSTIITHEQQHAEVVYINSEEAQSQGSDSSQSTVVDDSNELVTIVDDGKEAYPQVKGHCYTLLTDSPMDVVAVPQTPEIVVINEDADTEKEMTADDFDLPGSKVQGSLDPPQPGALLTSIKKRDSKRHLHPRVPQRYLAVDSRNSLRTATSKEDHSPASNIPKRSASFLQRLRLRRGTSFKSERKPKKRLPVRRSFSERIMYHIRKGWVDYKEDLDFISNPSRLRSIGRMIDRKAGRLHIVQLHKPSSGHYGIFISESKQRGGIFVSRFADSNSAKFYSGLIEPGDEIVKINKENIRDKSVDYAYDLLAKLDSVIFTVIPVNSRPDW